MTKRDEMIRTAERQVRERDEMNKAAASAAAEPGQVAVAVRDADGLITTKILTAREITALDAAKETADADK